MSGRTLEGPGISLRRAADENMPWDRLEAYLSCDIYFSNDPQWTTYFVCLSASASTASWDHALDLALLVRTRLSAFATLT